jgi:hypothetical protein
VAKHPVEGGISEKGEAMSAGTTARILSQRISRMKAKRCNTLAVCVTNGDSNSTIEATVPRYRNYINRWRRRFLADLLGGLLPGMAGNRRRR